MKLVTGGYGLVGSQIYADKHLNSKDGDLRNQVEVNKIFEKYKPKLVYHCAGKVGGIGDNMNHLAEFFYDNIMINTNVIEASRKYGVEKLLSILSTCVFPNKCTYPLTPEQIHNGEPHSSNYAYAYAKRMAEVQSRAYRDQYGCNFICVIPTNVYGPHDRYSLEGGHVIPSLIHKCYLAKRDNKDFEVWGSGKPLREFIFSRDLGELIMWSMRHYDHPEPLILSTGKEISIGEVVEKIAKSFDFKGNIVMDASKPDGQFRKPSDNSRLKKLYPSFNFTPFEDGIQESVDWFVKNFEKARK